MALKEIWIINQYSITPDLPGGTRHYDLGVELVKAGYTVRIFAANVNLALSLQIRDLGAKLWLEEPVDGVRYVWTQSSVHTRNDWRRALNMFRFSWNVFRAGLQQGTRPELIIGSSPHLFAAYAGHSLAKRLGCRFFFEVRDLWPQSLVDMNGISAGHPMVWLMGNIEQKLYRNAEQVIVLAEGSIPYIKEKGVPGECITYIPNGVHLNHFATSKTRDENRKTYGFDKFTIIYTGAHGPANALHTVLQAAGELREQQQVEFVLVGGGPAKSELQAQAHKMGLKNVRFMNPIPKGEIPDLLNAADATLITLKDARSFYTAVSPNKLFDYFAAGKPVLCAAPGNAADMVRHYNCGLTSPPEDGLALAKQVLALSQMPADQLKHMGAKGKELVLSRFSRAKLVNRLISLIEGTDKLECRCVRQALRSLDYNQ